MRKWNRIAIQYLSIFMLVFSSVCYQVDTKDIAIAEAAVKAPKVQLTEYTDYLNVSDEFIFKAKVTGTDEKVKWSVTDKKIAMITSKGKLTALHAGSVEVCAKAGKAVTKYKVTIGTGMLSTLASELTLYEDKTIYINADNLSEDDNITFENGNKKVIDGDWGYWEGNSVPLTIHVVGAGKDTIIIRNKTDKERLIIHVTVGDKSKRRELSAKELYKKCGSSTVEIKATNGSSSSLGSGFFVAKNQVATNYHVILGANEIAVTTKDNKEFAVSRILGYSEELDLAVLEVNAPKYDPLTQGSGDASVGDTVYALGSPLGLTGTMTNGMVSTASRVIDGTNYIQITTPISPGNSGGPLVNVYGEVIGVNTMYYENGQNLNFSINILELQKVDMKNPITVEDYSTKYWKQFEDYMNANRIEEDPIKSQFKDACQEIPSMTLVNGKITLPQFGDLYCFTITEAGWYYGIVTLPTLDDMKNTYLDLYNSNLDFLAGCDEYAEKNKLYTRYYLNPGKYYVYISVNKSYTGTEIPYELLLIYK